jgi:hypothetical protein
MNQERYEALRREWVDQYVEVNPDPPELKRFAGVVGRVVAVNYNLKALVLFPAGKDGEDGGWYDITASEEYLKKVPPEEGKQRYKESPNTAKAFPEKQG